MSAPASGFIDNPDEAAQILADAGKIDLAVAKKQLTERTVLDKDVGAPGDKVRAALDAVVPILTRMRNW